MAEILESNKAIPLELSQAQIYIQEKFPNLIGKLNNQFRNEMKGRYKSSTYKLHKTN